MDNRLFSTSCYKLSIHYITYFSMYILQFIDLVLIDIELPVFNKVESSKLRGQISQGVNEPGANKPEDKSARHGGDSARGQKRQEVNKPGGESTRERKSQGAKKPGGKTAKGRKARHLLLYQKTRY